MSLTVLRVAIGITVYSVAMNVLVFILSKRNAAVPAGLELAAIFVSYSFFLLLPVRWLLLLVQIVRSIRTRPLKRLPSVPMLQIVVAAAIHVLFGLLSFIGFLTLWMETKTGDRVFGLILHALLPSMTIVWLYRRATAPFSDDPLLPHGRYDRTAQGS